MTQSRPTTNNPDTSTDSTIVTPMKESWEDFKYEYIETGWFNYDRAKTFKAMRRLWEKIPEGDLAPYAQADLFRSRTDGWLARMNNLPVGTNDPIGGGQSR